ncbi:MAG: hypothetical protein IJR68_11300 [Fretibacterium sp.]|nr:hypothetical protein [Fretibacterium sp.]
MTNKWPYDKAYIWKGKAIGVVPGLGSNVFIVARETGGGHKRIVSPSLPVCTTAEIAQIHLDKFAADRGLLEAGDE